MVSGTKVLINRNRGINYENNIELQGWNGMLDGKKAENENYLIVVNGTTIFGEEINLNGVFVLL